MKNKIIYGNIKTPEITSKGKHFKAYRLHQESSFDLMNPVLNIDHFFMSAPTFPVHPHAGFSAITYMFEDSENGFINRDSLGGEIEINPGDLHWTQAARGILHEESPKINGVVCHGLQIFMNLPKEMKNTDPKVYHVENSKAPRVKTSNGVAVVKVVTGQFQNTRSDVQLDWATDLLQLKWLEDGPVKISLAAGQSAFILSLTESVEVGDKQRLPKFAAIAACNKESEMQEFEISAQKNSDIVIIRSQVISEPAFSHGPFVATDAREMNLVIDRYNRGEFGTLTPRDEK